MLYRVERVVLYRELFMPILCLINSCFMPSSPFDRLIENLLCSGKTGTWEALRQVEPRPQSMDWTSGRRPAEGSPIGAK